MAIALALAMVAISCAPVAAPSAPAPAPQATPRAAAPAPPSTPAPPAPPSASPTPAAAKAETPRYGGTLRIGAIANPANFDAQQDPSINVYIAVTPIYNGIVQYDDETGSKIVPALAESWTVSGDSLTYTFKVRQGVKFHDGTPLTTDDIVYNLQRVKSPPKGIISNLGWLLAAVTKIEKVGDDSVRLTLDYPFAPLMTVLAHNSFPIYPRRVVEAKGDMKTTAIGTGPFKFKSYTPGVSFAVMRNPDYWNKGRPYVDAVTFPILSDRGTYIAALRTGQLDLSGRYFAGLSPSERDTVKQSIPAMAIYPGPTVAGPWYQFNTRQGSPLSDVRVRKAVSLAFDRQSALKVVAEGAGALGGVFIMYEDWGLSPAELTQLPGFRQPKDQDIAQARKLMADAGYPNGFELTILSRTNKATRDASIFLAAQLQPLGIQSKVEVVEDAVHTQRRIDSNFQVWAFTTANVLPDPHWMTRYFVPGSPLHSTGLKDARITELADKQVREPDPAKRRQLLQEMERYFLTEVLDSLPGVNPITFLAASPKIRGFTPGISDYEMNHLESIWLAE
ncbi:MAG: ABC transporter substrate-binding protein [Dehalococcoidia bacterium]|nr:ABC transporter substrate-binding protein [Dehalococcoidia bacterium]